MAEEFQIRIDDPDDDDASLRRIEALNRQAEESRARTEQHRREAAAYRAEAVRRDVENSILTVDSEVRAARSAYAEAFETGDHESAAAATERLAGAQAKRTLLEGQAAAIQQHQYQPQSTGDAAEDFARTLTPRSAQWVREHADWVRDPAKYNRMMSGHHAAVGAGIPVESPEYFEMVERTVTGNHGDRNSRGNGSMQHGSSDSRNEVRLSKGELERSEDGSIVWNKGDRDLKGEIIRDGDSRIGKPIGRQAYAYRKQQMERSGYFNRI